MISYPDTGVISHANQMKRDPLLWHNVQHNFQGESGTILLTQGHGSTPPLNSGGTNPQPVPSKNSKSPSIVDVVTT